MRKPFVLVCSCVIIGAASSAAIADQVRFSRELATGHATAITFGTLDDARNPGGSVPFGISIRIENTTSDDFDDIDDNVLTGVFWNMGDGQSINQYIDLSQGTNGWEAFGGQVVYDDDDIQQGTGGPGILAYWAFREGLQGDNGDNTIPDNFLNPNFGLGAESYGVFDDSDIIDYDYWDYYDGGVLDGLDGGIISETGTPPGSSGPDLRVDGNDLPVWREFIQFNIYLLPGFFDTFSLDQIAEPSWQFGNDFDDTGVPAGAVIPLPTGAAMGLAGLGMITLRRRR